MLNLRMLTKTFLSSKLFFVLSLMFFAGVLPTAASAATSTTEQALSGIDSYAARVSEYLQATKAYFDRDIAGLQTAEASTTQTDTGRAINQAVGDNSFVPATKPTGTPWQTAQRIAEQVLVFFIIIALYILAHKTLMYITLAIIVFILIRLVWRMVGRQQF